MMGLSGSAVAAAGRLSQSLVACNIYVSAGGKPSHVSILLNLLQQAQDQCTLLSTSMSSSTSTERVLPTSTAAIVHAYADPVYNRSSFHLAGTAENVVNVASLACSTAIQLLRTEMEQEQEDGTAPFHHHPYVGLVDHVTVMDLETDEDSSTTFTPEFLTSTASVTGGNSNVNSNDDDNDDAFQPTSASAWAARSIGQTLADLNVHVYYYGQAHPDNTALAIIRRERTNFFQSGGLDDDALSHTATAVEVATVGAPTDFSENYNVRLTAACSKKRAQSLTRRVRERDGGFRGVEALTLPYSESRWEVACNLLQPKVASADDIQALVDQWSAEQRTETGESMVEQGYRVGTTAEQCQGVLSQSTEERQQHNKVLRKRLQSYMQSSSIR